MCNRYVGVGVTYLVELLAEFQSFILWFVHRALDSFQS